MTSGWKTAFKPVLTQEGKNARTAATRGMKLTIDGASGLKELMRGQVRGAGLGDRLANTIRGVVYPKSGVSLGAAGTVYSKAPHILTSFTEGTLIRSTKGSYLAIPTDECPKGRGGRRMKPEEATQRFGPPVSVPTKKGGFLLLYETTVTKSGKRRTTLGRKRAPKKTERIAFFVLVHAAKMKKRLDPAAALTTAGARLNANIALSWPEDAK